MIDLAKRILDSRLVLPVLVVASALLALTVSHFVYPALSWNRDEAVYRWQAELLGNGQLTLGDLGHPSVTQPWLSGHRDGAFFSQYPLGWPLVVLVGQKLGWPAISLALAAALAVAGNYAMALELTRDRRVASLSGGLLLVSPVLVVQSGTYLTYLFAIGLGTLFTASFRRGLRCGSRPSMVAAGLLLGWLVMTRTFDAVVWAAVVGGFTMATEYRHWRVHLRLVPAFLLAVVPMVVIQLAHNRYLTGSPLEFPMTVADPLDTFGFGERRIMPGMDKVNYSISSALRSTAKNAFFVPWFLVGAHLGAVVAALAVVDGRRLRSTWLLLALGVGFPAGYFAFWGMSVSALTARLSGPIYYIAAYSSLTVLIAMGLVSLVRRSPRSAVAVVVVMAVVTVPVTIGRLGLNRHLSRMQTAWRADLSDMETPAIVVVSPTRYLMYLNPEASNSVDSVTGRDPVIWATDRTPDVIELIDAHPERRAYLQRPAVPTAELLPSEHAAPFEVETLPVVITRADVVRLPVRVRAKRAGSVSIALVVDGVTFWRDVTADASKGEVVNTTFTLVAPNGPPVSGGLRLKRGGERLGVLVGYGANPSLARANPSVRYTLLAQAGPTLEVMEPGTTWRPDENIQDRLVWRDARPSSELRVEVHAGG